MYAEKGESIRYDNRLTLEKLIDKVYPNEIAEYIKDGIRKLRVLTANQVHNNDVIGRDVEFENELFKST